MESSGCIYASVTIIMIGKETTACGGEMWERMEGEYLGEARERKGRGKVI